MIIVKSDGLEQLVTAIKAMQDPVFRRYFSEQFYLKRVKPELEKYPTPRRAPMEFVSDKQRRYFFAALSRGGIQIPYQRTNLLKRSWMFTAGADGGVVTNRTPYAAYVLGVPGQAGYHQGWWRTVDEVAVKATGNRLDAFAGETAQRWFQQYGVKP